MRKLARLSFLPLLAFLLCLTACDWLKTSDDENPTLSIQSPTSYFSWVTTGETMDLAGTAADNESIKSVKITVNGHTVSAAGKTSWTADDLPLALGENLVVAKVADKAGNTATDTLWVTRNHDVEFSGIPWFSQNSIFKGQTSHVTVRQALGQSAKGVSSVKLVRLNPDLSIAGEVGSLYDDGDLNNHHDEILGDGVYSGFLGIYEENTGTALFRVEASTNAPNDNYSPLYRVYVYDTVGQTEIDNIVANHQDLDDVLNATGATSLAQAADSLKYWFEHRPGVAAVDLVDGHLEVTYASGITGGVIFSETDADGNIITKGNFSAEGRSVQPSVPIGKQTRGENSLRKIPSPKVRTPKTVDPTAIQDKDVLIWAPFENAFSVNMRPGLEDIFDNSDLDLNVVSLTNQECTIASLENLADYGTIIVDSHGAGGEHILTGELMTAGNLMDHLLQLIGGQISYFENITYSNVGGFAKNGTVYSVRSSYIANLSGTLPNSVVFNGSCESTKTLNLANAFLGKGARAYLGYDRIVSTTFCKDTCDAFFTKMAIEHKDNGDAFTSGQTDPGSHHATFNMIAFTNDLHYSFDLINGDFEMGSLNGWTRAGDGRVITQLAGIMPPEGNYMGIISTGLGYITDSGSISQSFKVPDSASNLSLKWNFISEEFMEWVGSQFQDYLTFAIVDSAGTEHVIFHNTIDTFTAFDLIDSSPPIVFDHGDTYMTDWHQFIADITAYRGQVIRLVIYIGDVGDSSYDSACLLDQIMIY